MKNIILNTLLIFVLLGCNKNNQFFHYDKLEHYHIDISEDKVFSLEENKSKKQAKLLELLQGYTPDTLSEISILNGIEKVGYKKKEISTSKFESINKIFSEKISLGINEEMSCIAIYRDILVFKNNNKIVGVAKLCFDCQQFIITGTKKILKILVSQVILMNCTV